MITRCLTNQKGVSLIEVTIAVGLLIIVVTALVRLGITTLNNSDSSRVRSLALQHATGVIDYLRWYRDNNQNDFFALNDGSNYFWNGNLSDAPQTTTCDISDPLNPTLSGACQSSILVNESNVEIFQVIDLIHSVDYGGASDNRTDVTVYVFWNNKGSFSNVQASTYLTKWRK